MHYAWWVDGFNSCPVLVRGNYPCFWLRCSHPLPPSLPPLPSHTPRFCIRTHAFPLVLGVLPSCVVDCHCIPALLPLCVVPVFFILHSVQLSVAFSFCVSQFSPCGCMLVSHSLLLYPPICSLCPQSGRRSAQCVSPLWSAPSFTWVWVLVWGCVYQSSCPALSSLNWSGGCSLSPLSGRGQLWVLLRSPPSCCVVNSVRPCGYLSERSQPGTSRHLFASSWGSRRVGTPSVRG